MSKCLSKLISSSKFFVPADTDRCYKFALHYRETDVNFLLLNEANYYIYGNAEGLFT